MHVRARSRRGANYQSTTLAVAGCLRVDSPRFIPVALKILWQFPSIGPVPSARRITQTPAQFPRGH